MKEAGDIAALSVPFTLGVGAGTFITEHLNLMQEHVAAEAAMMSCFLLLALFVHQRGGRWLPPVIFLFLGIFCSISHDLCSGMLAVRSISGIRSLPGRCVRMLRDLIASVPFRHDSTNALVSALLTGDRSGLSAEQTASFRDSGASHILALSGLHLGFIYLMVSRMLSIAGNGTITRRARSVVIIAFAGFYTLMTGAGPSIVRALIFIVLNEISSLSPERRRTPARTLMTALTIQLAFDPSVISSLGFQLSYLAMTGIMFLYPTMSAWYPDDARINVFNPMKKLWDSTVLTVSCQIFTAPLVWIRFHTFPKYFIITNLTAVPLTSVIISVSVMTICLHGLGICPEALVRADDFLVQAMLYILGCISGM